MIKVISPKATYLLIRVVLQKSVFSTMDPQQFANKIERYIKSLDDEEPQDNISFEFQNANQNSELSVQTGEDELDLVDGP